MRFFLIIGGLLGSLLCVFIPYGAGFDEEHHLPRIYAIAYFRWLPNDPPPGNPLFIPENLLFRSYQRNYLRAPAWEMFQPEQLYEKRATDYLGGFRTRSTYPPFLFLPQALVARRLWLAWDWPVLPSIWLIRWVGMLMYLLLSACALRILPRGRWALVVLALSPMALFQAATLNMDGITNALAFVLVALCLRLRADARPWHWMGLVLVLILLAVSKPGGSFAGLFLLILPWRTLRPRWAGILLGLLLLAGLFFNLFGWSDLIANHEVASDPGEMRVSQQANLILSQPFSFALAFAQVVLGSLPTLLMNWIASYGYWAGSIPWLVYLLYPLALLGALCSENEPTPSTSHPVRTWAGLSFAAALCATLLVYYALHYTPGQTEVLRQGRYLIALMPMLLLVWSRRNRHISPMRLSRLSLLALCLSLLAYGYGLYATYYSFCAHTAYTGQACRLPVYQNLDRDGSPTWQVNAAAPLLQTFRADCGPLQQVEIYIRQTAQQPNATLSIHLSTQSGQSLADQTLTANAVQSGAYLSLPIQPAAGKVGETYSLLLRSDAAAGDGFLVAISNGSEAEAYPQAALVSPNLNPESDLLFRYYCPGFWRGIFHSPGANTP